MNEIKDSIYHTAKGNIAKAQMKYKNDYDKKCWNGKPLQPGTLVLVRNSQRDGRKGGKFQNRWLGLYRILEFLGKGIYKLANPKNDRQLKECVNICRLKVFYSSTHQTLNFSKSSIFQTQTCSENEDNDSIQPLPPPILEDSIPSLPPPISPILEDSIPSLSPPISPILDDSIFDSLPTIDLPKRAKEQIAAIVCTSKRKITLDFQAAQVAMILVFFSIAFATSLCIGINPSSMSYHQDLLRKHLSDCLVAGQMSPFPGKPKKPNRTRNKIKLCVYCKCRQPEDGRMVLCGFCKDWFHEDCEVIPKMVWEKKECQMVLQYTCKN